MKRRLKKSDIENRPIRRAPRRPPIWMAGILSLVLAAVSLLAMQTAANSLSNSRRVEAYANDLSVLVTTAHARETATGGPVPGSELAASASMVSLEPSLVALEAASDSGAVKSVRSAFDTMKADLAAGEQAILTGQTPAATIEATSATSNQAFLSAVGSAQRTLHEATISAQRVFVIFSAAIFGAIGIAVCGLIFLVNRQRGSEHRVRVKQETRFRAMMQHSSDLIALLDADSSIQSVSSSSFGLLGRVDLGLNGRRFLDIVHHDDRPEVVEMLSLANVRENGTVHAVARLGHTDGSWRSFEMVAASMSGTADMEGLLVTCRELPAPAPFVPPVAQSAPAQSLHHPVTGLIADPLFQDRLDHALARSSRTAGEVSLLAIDLGAAQIFDTLSDEARMTGLRTIAGRLARTIRSGDTIAHLEQRQLMILLEDTSVEVAYGVAERVIEQLQTPVSLLNGQLLLEPRVGVGCKRDPRDSSGQLLQRALEALQQATTDNPVAPPLPTVDFTAAEVDTDELLEMRPLEFIDDSGVTESQIDELELFFLPEEEAEDDEIVIAEAIEELPIEGDEPAEIVVNQPIAPYVTASEATALFDPNEFDVQFLPALALDTGEIVELETVARWKHPHRGLVAVEASGNVDHFVPWLIEYACSVSATLPPGRDGRRVRMSVNLPASVRLDRDMIDGIAATILATSQDPSSLQIEIPARSLRADGSLDDVEIANIAQIRELGVRVAIDGAGAEADLIPDFGRLSIDTVKIDRSLISLLDRSAERRARVRSIIERAREHSVTVNGSGVESLDQAERLWDLGADEGQGPLFFRPVSAEQLNALFTAQPALVAAD